MDKNTFLSNLDPASIDGVYQQYKTDPGSVSPDWARFFEGFDLARTRYPEMPGQTGSANGMDCGPSNENVAKEFKVIALINGYRERGHLFTHTNPVRERRTYTPPLELAYFGLSEDDLGTVFEAGSELGIGKATLAAILEHLKTTYCQSIGVEYRFIRDVDRVDWLQKRMEKDRNTPVFTLEEKKEILRKLDQAVVFERFLGKKFIGQKRFSLEGGETLIPALDTIIEHGADAHGINDVVIGMAHRGRLNVLANTFNKTYESIFADFEGRDFEDNFVEGDVKYHMGFNSCVVTNKGKGVNLILCPNPSHLESVGPVMQGISRALIEKDHAFVPEKLCPVIIHGDAAIAGQGVVYELVQMARLKPYSTGGTLHVVVNNQVGFTTNYVDGRSSTYCTDVAKVTQCPVFHVNGDDAEAVCHVMKLALDFRQHFQSDVFIDLLGYRRHGHNEGDEPKFTQPILYKAIATHKDPREIYREKLEASGTIEASLAEEMQERFNNMLQERLTDSKELPKAVITSFLADRWMGYERADDADLESSPETGVKKKLLLDIAAKLAEVPAGKKFFNKLERILHERAKMVAEDRLDWGMGELLAYGSLLCEGHSVRLTGQDVERGTFSHRHAVVKVEDSEEEYIHLKNLQEGQALMQVYNSPLNEYAVLGYEYGYAFATPASLTLWEAQFGDFVNGAQIIIDQYLSAAEEKWNAMNGLVMLLPHGYEGQGAEHSSGRMERFLQQCADANMILANPTTPANFFHLLRRQLAWKFRKPLVVFTPKSLLRHPKCVSTMDDLAKGRFQEVYDDPTADPKNVKTLILCSGKLYYELLERKEKVVADDVALVRIEQLHPLPEPQLEAVFARYANVEEVRWVQEEPENMGAWPYIFKHLHKVNGAPSVEALKFVARRASGAPATGSGVRSALQQQRILEDAFVDRPSAPVAKKAKTKVRA
ncbi:MAG TPA: 2-oxoglutarate dehydrogenase E1 component [Flavobacteriales bacterium]|jgi:2-oxoglutarate dehydrogenase E1 component|nr:2-oxoglutarate dehydrogenase E1 component [Flavobacteriales bacterium]MBK7249065.1 2-oxoglutarate dehydrogenase E1 component [Flavobacteriales bacterium]HQV38431.1 2-oxoglutarate dehydrogenase E1 component [Flavobacteriales bacterium]HQW31872.1 2-oxoglutarate dehydrogenase E1 component [Flavobacteriales bacterium]HQY02411.1 2-oxoglutarate dehydrogenase E1 component [Flavobacteriales bacterium]